ncbi:Thioredoxin [Candidatus Hodgkinia cicadicola]|nr:Thioredoxin [Candidatus Hodgkinia cicadicola]
MRSLKRALESKVSSLILIWSSLSLAPSASELKLKLLSFYANYRGLIKLGLNIWVLCFCFKTVGRWAYEWARQQRRSEWLTPNTE